MVSGEVAGEFGERFVVVVGSAFPAEALWPMEGGPAEQRASLVGLGQDDGDQGRDASHWPAAESGLAAGGARLRGLRTLHVLGEELVAPRVGPCSR